MHFQHTCQWLYTCLRIYQVLVINDKVIFILTWSSFLGLIYILELTHACFLASIAELQNQEGSCYRSSITINVVSVLCPGKTSLALLLLCKLRIWLKHNNATLVSHSVTPIINCSISSTRNSLCLIDTWGELLKSNPANACVASEFQKLSMHPTKLLTKLLEIPQIPAENI